MHPKSKISPCLWFDHQAEEAAGFYTATFPNSRIVGITRYKDAGREVHGKPAGSVMTVSFELDGLAFMALNGGPHFKFNEAISFRLFRRICGCKNEHWAQLRLDRRVSPPAFTFASPR